MSDPLPYFSHPMQAAWIAEHGDLPRDQVDAVLSVEWEYMVATGIAQKPPGTTDWEFRYYRRDELIGAPHVLDTLRIAQDAERLAGVPREIGLAVLDVELRFLQLRGLA